MSKANIIDIEAKEVTKDRQGNEGHPKVSVIIPVFNNEQFLGNCLDSVLSQTYQNLEVVVVNDGSTDASLSLAKSYQSKDKRVLVVDQENKGIHFSRVRGVKASSGDFILNMDADDSLEPRAIELMTDEMLSFNADIVFVNHFNVRKGRKKLVCNHLPESGDKLDAIKFLLLGKLSGYIWGRLFKKKLLEPVEIRSGERVITEDFLTNLSVLSATSLRLRHIKMPLVNYTMHENLISFSRNRRNIQSYFEEVILVEDILKSRGLLVTLNEEFAAYKCRIWILYCRAQGDDLYNKNFRLEFFRANYPMARKYLKLYQRLEIKAYTRSPKLGVATTNFLLWMKKTLGI